MILDLFLILPILFGIYKGYKSGILKVFLMLVFFLLGLSLGLNFIPVVGSYLKSNFDINPSLLPFISFLLIFILTIVVGVIVLKLLERFLSLIYLGWLNRLIGAFFGLFMVVLIESTILWLGSMADLIPLEAKTTSISYSYIVPVGPFLYESVPLFKSWIVNLEEFFATYLN